MRVIVCKCLRGKDDKVAALRVFHFPWTLGIAFQHLYSSSHGVSGEIDAT